MSTTPETRLRALVMMPALSMEDRMVEFIERHAEVISKFRVTLPHKVLHRVRHLLGENAAFALGTEVNYLGGDAQVATQVVTHDVGAAFIFRDPIASPLADCDALLRLINVHNILNATNVATAECLIHVLREGVTTSCAVVDVMPSFVLSLESPAVAAYKAKQNAVIASHSSAAATPAPPRASCDIVFSTDVSALVEKSQKRNDFTKALDHQRSGRSDSGRLSGRQTPSSRSERSQVRNWPAVENSLSRRGRNVSRNPEALEQHERAKRNTAKMRSVARVIMALQPHLESHEEADQAHMEQAQSMRCLALISHNNMKGAMKDFVIRHQAVLKRFRLTGTASTMTMLREVLGTEGIVYGPTCSSGPLGGDAEVGALMCLEDLGGMFFFTDPLDPHPHTDDIKALIRMCDLHSLLHASNPTTGDALVRVLKEGLNDPGRIPTFYTTSMSRAIEWHRTDVRGTLYADEHWMDRRGSSNASARTSSVFSEKQTRKREPKAVHNRLVAGDFPGAFKRLFSLTP